MDAFLTEQNPDNILDIKAEDQKNDDILGKNMQFIKAEKQ